MADVAGIFQSIMQSPYKFRSLYIDWILIFEGLLLEACDETELVGVLCKVFQWEFEFCFRFVLRFEVIKLESLKVAQQHISW